jgi:hypothetical protein
MASERGLLGHKTLKLVVLCLCVFQNKKAVAEGLSSLVNICHAVHFRGFQEAKING